VKYRSLTRTTQPVVEPVSVAEAKAHLRVDSDEDNFYIASLLSSAREWVEVYLDRTLIQTQWTVRLDGFPIDDIELPRPPMSQTQTAVVITYTSEAGAVATLSSDLYRVDRSATPGVVRPLQTGNWPSHMDDANAVTITWWAGYGADGKSTPAPIRHAILMLVGFWFENRSAVNVGSISKQLEFAVDFLLSSQKWGGYQ
jgi:uncharacterized phiE125 gp8 family phage protein